MSYASHCAQYTVQGHKENIFLIWKQNSRENGSNFHSFIGIFLFDILVSTPIFNKFQKLFKFFTYMELLSFNIILK